MSEINKKTAQGFGRQPYALGDLFRSQTNFHSPKYLSPFVHAKLPNPCGLLFLNSPNNPSGQICNNLKEISNIAKKYNILWF